MAQVFKINSTTLTHVIDCQWIENPEGSIINGKSSKNRWRNVRLGGTMEESQFDILYTLLGNKVSVTITNYDDRNGDYKTYYGCDLLSVDGDHNGPRFDNVIAELKVLV